MNVYSMNFRTLVIHRELLQSLHSFAVLCLHERKKWILSYYMAAFKADCNLAECFDHMNKRMCVWKQETELSSGSGNSFDQAKKGHAIRLSIRSSFFPQHPSSASRRLLFLSLYHHTISQTDSPFFLAFQSFRKSGLEDGAVRLATECHYEHAIASLAVENCS